MDSESDSIKRSYEGISPFFYWFSKLFESKARIRSLALSGAKNVNTLLVIAPPTEFYLDELLQLNPDGENRLVYFSEKLKQKAEARLGERYTYTADIGSVEKLPYGDNKFDAIFAYCYLDFLEYEDRKMAAKETKRVLKSGGKLLATYLAAPGNIIERVNVSWFTRFGFLSKGVMVVEAEPVLRQTGFRNIEMLSCPQKGFPIALAYAEK